MPHFMIVLILHINSLNLSLIKKCLFLRNMEPLNKVGVRTTMVSWSNRDTEICNKIPAFRG